MFDHDFSDDLEVLLTCVREKMCDPDLSPLAQVTLLQLLELLSIGSGSITNMEAYYSKKLKEMEQRQVRVHSTKCRCTP